MSRSTVNEIFIIRCIACLSIVLLHSLTSAMNLFPNSDYAHVISGLQILLTFGTPVFIFISEFLISKSYPDGLPNGFFKKRVKYLLLPYVSMAIIYGIMESENFSAKSLAVEILRNVILGDFVGYFILIIFQFYVLHYLLHNKLKKWKMSYVLIVSFSINVLYLAFFNFVPPLEIIPQANYIWNRLSWLPFLGWIFYFVLGYYCGKNIAELKHFLAKYKKYILLGLVITIAIVLYSTFSEILTIISSKRIDILLLTTLMILFLFFISDKIKNVPPVVMVISNYSFNIYLLHKIVMKLLENLNFSSAAIHIILLFSISIIASVVIAKGLNFMLPFSKYIIGNTYNFKSR